MAGGTRTIEKQLATMEDLACGRGKVSQSRAGSSLVLGMIDLPYAVLDQAALQALDVTKHQRAFLDNVNYTYDSAAASGIKPNTGAGYWVKEAVTDNIAEHTVAVANELSDLATNQVKWPKDGTSATVGQTVPAGTTALLINTKLYYLAAEVGTAGILNSIDLNTPKVTIGTMDYNMSAKLPVPAAVNSPNAGAGFGGFRYTVTGGNTLNLFTS